MKNGKDCSYWLKDKCRGNRCPDYKTCELANK
jgi:hypothetical protein